MSYIFLSDESREAEVGRQRGKGEYGSWDVHVCTISDNAVKLWGEGLHLAESWWRPWKRRALTGRELVDSCWRRVSGRSLHESCVRSYCRRTDYPTGMEVSLLRQLSSSQNLSLPVGALLFQLSDSQSWHKKVHLSVSIGEWFVFLCAVDLWIQESSTGSKC